MSIFNAFDKLIALKQDACDHVEQKKIIDGDKIFCGDCAKELK